MVVVGWAIRAGEVVRVAKSLAKTGLALAESGE